MRPSKPIQTPAFFSLLVFLGINYLVGYELGHALTGSTVGAIAAALVMPCISLLVLALLGGRRARHNAIDRSLSE